MGLVLQEDKPTCLTPRKRAMELPTQASINALRAPEFDKMLLEFREANNALQGETTSTQRYTPKETKIPIFADSSLLRDGRVLLTTL